MLLLTDYTRIEHPTFQNSNHESDIIFINEFVKLACFDPSEDYFKVRLQAQLLFGKFATAFDRFQVLLHTAYYGTSQFQSQSPEHHLENVSDLVLTRITPFEDLRSVLVRIPALLTSAPELLTLRTLLASFKSWLDFTTPLIDAIDRIIGLPDSLDVTQQLSLTLKNNSSGDDINVAIFKYARDKACLRDTSSSFQRLVNHLTELQPEVKEAKTYSYKSSDDNESEADAIIEQELFSEKETCTNKNDFQQLIKSSYHITKGHKVVETGLEYATRCIKDSFKSLAWRSTDPYALTSNVYNDPANKTQQLKTYNVLKEFQTRVIHLQTLFEEHDVLDQLLKQIDRIFNLVNPPLISLCLSMERILQKAQEWQIMSPKDLQMDLQGIISLVIDFRRQELASWRSLLQAVDEKFNDDAVQEGYLFLSKLQICMHDSSEFEDVIDAFLLSAPAGQFPVRLELLQLLFSDATNLHMYYSLFLPQITGHIDTIRAPLEQELKAHLITITWNDTTLWALQQSIGKSHRLMSRTVRKYRDALNVPTSILLSRNQDISALSNPVVLHSELPLDQLTMLIDARIKELQSIDNVAIKEKAFVDLMRLMHRIGINLNHRPKLSINLILHSISKANNSNPTPLLCEVIKSARYFMLVDESLKKCDEMTARQIQAMQAINSGLMEYTVKAYNSITTLDYNFTVLRMHQPVHVSKEILDGMNVLKVAVEECHLMRNRFGISLLINESISTLIESKVEQWMERKDWTHLKNLVLKAKLESVGMHKEEQLLLEPIIIALNNLKTVLNTAKVVKSKNHPNLLKNILELKLVESKFDDSGETDILGVLPKGHLHLNLQLLSSYSTTSTLSLIDLLQCRLDPLYNAVIEHLYNLYKCSEDYIKSVIRLHSRLMLTFHLLSQRGFCRPKEATAQKNMPEGAETAEGQGKGDASEGTGMGEGKGEKDVGEEMEYEEQVTGTQNEESNPKEEKSLEQENDTPLDMREDFDAELKDLMDSPPEQPDNSEATNKDSKPKDQATPRDEHKSVDHENEEGVDDMKDELGHNDGDQQQLQSLDKSADAQSKDAVQKGKDDKLTIDDIVTAKDNDVDCEGEAQSWKSEDEDFEDLDDVEEDDDNVQTTAADFEMSEGGDDQEDFEMQDTMEEAGNELENEMDVESENEIENEYTIKSSSDESDLCEQVQPDGGSYAMQSMQGNGQMTSGIGAVHSASSDQKEELVTGQQSYTTNGCTEQNNSIESTSMTESVDQWYKTQHPIISERPVLEKQANDYTASQQFSANNAGRMGALATGRSKEEWKMPEIKESLPEKHEKETQAHEDASLGGENLPRSTQATKQHSPEDQMQKQSCPIQVIPSLDPWSHYEASTTTLASELCEQLRLILAPTVAAKLKGDYRTGKRLNLRKILPYIASQYRRDRIWLRRTRPSKRTYQVCIAIDNSRSMCNDPLTRTLAMQSFAMLTQALSKLEVGQTGVVAFGRETKVLHPLDSVKPIDGDALLQGLFFDEIHTDMQKLLEDLPDIYGQGKQDTTWKLLLILSDGICDNHSTLKRLLSHNLTTHRILPVFIILDTRPLPQSITQMTCATFAEDGELRLEKYLSTFPFEYFVVLREVERMPQIVAEAIKQWFEMVGKEE